MKKCSVENCNRKHYGLGYCQKHYQQILKYGTILERNSKDPNEIIIEKQICRMKLYNNLCEEIAETEFDLKYKEQIEKFKWFLKDGYVECNWCNENNKWQKMKLHQAIIYLSGQIIENNQEIDHKDTNRLNNLEDNLRICTKAQNSHNQKIKSNNTSGYKGVTFHKRNKKYQAQIVINNKQKHLGTFKEIEDAARAYNAAAIKYHGEFAVLNNIE